MEVERVSIGDIIESGKLNGKVTGPVWTGFPSSEIIGQIPVSEDQKLDKEYKKILKELESLFVKYRKMDMKELETGFPAVENKQTISSRIAFLLRELTLMPKYKVRTNVMMVAYVATYEMMQKVNPTELKHFGIGARQQMMQLQQLISGYDTPLIALIVDKNELKAKVVSLVTESQAKKFKNKSNARDLKRIVEEVLGRKNIPDDDVRKIIEGICASMYIADAAQVFQSDYYGSLIYESILYNYLFELYKEDQVLPPEERKYPKLTPDYIVGLDSLDELFDAVTKDYQYNFQTEDGYHAKLQADYVYENIEFIDMQSLFAAFMLRCLDTLESIEIQVMKSTRKELEEAQARVVYECEIDTSDGYDIEEIKNLCGVRKKILEAILKISRLPDDFTYKVFKHPDDVELSSIAVSQMKEKMQNFCGDFYLNPSIKQYLRIAVFKSRHEELIENSEMMKRLEFSESEIQTLAMVDSNILHRWIELGFMNEESIKQLAVKIKNGEIDEIVDSSFQGKAEDVKKTVNFYDFITLNLEAENISVLNLIDKYYMEGIVPEEYVLDLSDEQINQAVTSETLLQNYQMYSAEMVSHNTNSDKEDEVQMQVLKKKIAIYTKLFEKAYLKNLSLEEQAISKKELVEEFYLNLVSQDMPDQEISPLVAFMLQEMLQNGFVDYETVYETSFMGSYITELRKRNIFSLAETRKIREILGSQKCGEIISGIIDSKDLSQNQKFALIMDFFFQNSDIEIRDELVKKLEFFAPEFFQEREKGSNKPIFNDDISSIPKEDEEKKEPIEYTRHLYSDGIKWEVYHRVIDNDVKVTTYSNGYVEFYSPRAGKRFIEKFYKVDRKTNQIVEPAYGFPTYAIDDEKYIANRHRLVKNVASDGKEAINPVILQELAPLDKAFRTPHITQSADKNWIRQMVSKYGSVYGDDEKLADALIKEYENQHEIID